MKSINQQDTALEKDLDFQNGTTIISVVPKKQAPFQSTPPKKQRRKAEGRRHNIPKIMNQYNQQIESQIHDQETKQVQRHSQGKMRGVDEQTAGQIQQNGLATPYEFLTQRSPSLFRIFFPRFALKSITFALTVVYLVAFLVLIGYNYSKSQTAITWNCSLYQLQNKYYPRLIRNYEIWRVVTSALFHSNIAHFCLDLFALQVYGYFVEWYLGKKAFIAAIVISIIYGHFFASALQKTSVSTTSSAILMTIVALKIYFLWQYRNYKKLYDRRNFLYILLAIIVAINLIPIFVVNNVDYSAHLGGFLAGAMLGMFFFKHKMEEPTKLDLLAKWGSLALLIISLVIVIAVVFSDQNPDYTFLASQIEIECQNNHP